VAAGHIEEGETATQAMSREAKEELGIKINAKDLVFAQVMHRHADRDSIDFFFFCTTWKGRPQIGEPEKCDEIKWVKRNELPVNTVPYIRVALETALAGQKYSELGW